MLTICIYLLNTKYYCLYLLTICIYIALCDHTPYLQVIIALVIPYTYGAYELQDATYNHTSTCGTN